MEPFRGKASGKTAEEKLADNVLFAQIVYAAEARAEKAEKRIAELEAELARERAPRIAYMERCAKAEAEVDAAKKWFGSGWYTFEFVRAREKGVNP